MLSRSRRALVIAAVIVIAIVALASRAFLAKDATAARYRTEAATRGALVAEVTATGTVNPVTTVQVGVDRWDEAAGHHTWWHDAPHT